MQPKEYPLQILNNKLMFEIITKEIIREFLDNNSLELKSTHHRLSLPIINRIYNKMMSGIRFDDIKICGDLIIDGHHRYISSLIAEVKIGNSKCLKSSATVEYKWTAVDFTEMEWDTEDKIQYLNELDAEFNNISMEEIIEITK